MDEQEQQRRALEKLPPFAPGANPLLGRWVRAQPGPQAQGVLAQALALGSDVLCTQVSGGGEFEFRDNALVRGGHAV